MYTAHMSLKTYKLIQKKKSKEVWLKGKEKEVAQDLISSVFFTARHTPISS